MKSLPTHVKEYRQNNTRISPSPSSFPHSRFYCNSRSLRKVMMRSCMGNDQHSSTQRPSQKQSHHHAGEADHLRGATTTTAAEKILDNGDIFAGRKAVAAARAAAAAAVAAAAAAASAAGNPDVEDGGYGAAFGSTELLPEEIPGLPRRRPAYSPRQVKQTLPLTAAGQTEVGVRNALKIYSPE